MNDQEIIKWLLKGDVSIQYQVHRDLLDEDRPDLQSRIESEGWGKAKMNMNFLEIKLKEQATARNWKTINTLLSLAVK